MRAADLTIHDLGPQGDGIHQGASGRIYVERALPGDRVSARVRRDADGHLRADILDLLAPSPYRREPPCPHYQVCGNCSLQHLDEKIYRDWKAYAVREAFLKQGLEPRRWLETRFLGEKLRRRATFAVVKERGRVTAGYYRRRTKQITEIPTCLVADPEIFALRAGLAEYLAPALIDGQTVDVFVQSVPGAVDMVITGPVGPKLPAAAARLVECAGVTRVGWRAGEDGAIRRLAQSGDVQVRFGRLTVDLPPAAFLQPTQAGEAALTQAVLTALPARGRFADLFSGCGTFSGPMLERGPVSAFEAVSEAVQALRRAAGAEALEVFRRDLFKNPLRRDELNRFDAVVFDPPRAGCAAQAEELARTKAGVLIGVSCNPSTFARDARAICRGGFRLQSLQVVDQFLWSHHAEVVGVFTK